MSNVWRRTHTSRSPIGQAEILIISLFVSAVLSALSVIVERIGPEMAQYGNLCGSESSDLCLRPILKGGFPIAFLFDQPGVSIEGRLSFAEDQFRVGAFALNALIYFAALVLASRSARSIRMNKSQ